MISKGKTPIGWLKKPTQEFIQLTALRSLKIVLRGNKDLRKKNQLLQDKLDEFMENPDIRGLSRKVNEQKARIDYLESQMRKIKLLQKGAAKGSGSIGDIIDQTLIE